MEYTYKICVVGDIGTGKTSLIKRLVHGIFSPHYRSTIGMDFTSKTVVKEFDKYNLIFWDFAGAERFGNKLSTHYKDCDMAFVHIDATRESTEVGAIKWKQSLDSIVGCPVILLVCKSDLMEDAKPYDDFCDKYGFKCWQFVSAKNATGLDTIYDTILETVKAHPKTKFEIKTETKSETDDARWPKVMEDLIAKSETKASECQPEIIEDHIPRFEVEIIENPDEITPKFIMPVLNLCLSTADEKGKIAALKSFYINLYFPVEKNRSLFQQIREEKLAKKLFIDIRSILMSTTKTAVEIIDQIVCLLMNTGHEIHF